MRTIIMNNKVKISYRSSFDNNGTHFNQTFRISRKTADEINNAMEVRKNIKYLNRLRYGKNYVNLSTSDLVSMILGAKNLKRNTVIIVDQEKY